MAKPKPRATKKTLRSYTIKRTNKIIKPGDCVLMRPPKPSRRSYVAKIERIELIGRHVKVHVQWYYRPEDTVEGRKNFHGRKELLLSDHRDVQSADAIEGKCTVHTLNAYQKLRAVRNHDFFSRFQYKCSTGVFCRNMLVAVYCKCAMPYNPDKLMVQCDRCGDWFHPACIGMTSAEAKRTDHFICETCSTEEQQLLQNSLATSQDGDAKVGTKRRRGDATVKEEMPDEKIKKEQPDAEVKKEEKPDAEVKEEEKPVVEVKKEEPDV